MTFAVLLQSVLRQPAERASLVLWIQGIPFPLVPPAGEMESRSIDILDDDATLNIRLDAHFGNESVSADAETHGAKGISIIQPVPDSVRAHFLHAAAPAANQCRVRCPNGDWIYGQPGGTCVTCTTASGKQLTLCC